MPSRHAGPTRTALDSQSPGHPRRRAGRRGGWGRAHPGTGARRRRPVPARRGVRRQPARRRPRAGQHAPPLLPDPYPRLPGGAGPPAVPVAAGAVSALGASHPGCAGRRRDGGDGGAAAVRLHHHDRPPLRVPAGAGGRHRHRGRGGIPPGHPRGADARLHGPFGAGWRPAARGRGAGRRHDPCRQRAADRPAPRPAAPRHAANRAGAVLALLRHDRADALDRGAGRADRRAAAHPLGGNGGRGGVLPGAVRLLAAGLPGRVRLAAAGHLAGARHPFLGP